jgi:tetratricopeptide (TPR) repeat protein
MIRFLILCTIFFLLYLGFSAIGEFDSSLHFTAYGYEMESTIFTFGALFVAVQLVLMIVLKMIFLIFDLPTIIKKKWHNRRLVKINKKLLNVLAELLMGNRKKSLSLTNGMISEIDDDNKEVINLVLAEAEEGFDKKIQHFRNLIDKKNYSVYACKRLAEIFYKNTHHKQAEECALKAFNEDDTDTGLMLILIRIYASLGEWPKLVFIVSKLRRADVKIVDKNAPEIATYYYDAAKSYLQGGSDDEALKYLESALELNPKYIEALNLFTELSMNLNNTVATLKILRAAFSANPCFEIARMFADNSTSSAEAIYGTLAGIAQPGKYPALFLALAAYLGLIEKITELKAAKLISYEPAGSVSK